MKKLLFYGVIGGVISSILCLILLIGIGGYNYTPIKVINPQLLEIPRKDSCNNLYSVDKFEVINEFSRKGILLTPDEYTNHVVSYYNTIITILISLFIIFSFLGYFSIKTKVKEEIEDQIIKTLDNKIKDSLEFKALIDNNLSGIVDDKLGQLMDKMETIENDLRDLQNKYLEQSSGSEIIN